MFKKHVPIKKRKFNEIIFPKLINYKSDFTTAMLLFRMTLTNLLTPCVKDIIYFTISYFSSLYKKGYVINDILDKSIIF